MQILQKVELNRSYIIVNCSFEPADDQNATRWQTRWLCTSSSDSSSPFLPRGKGDDVMDLEVLEVIVFHVQL